ncbi:uncharacterized protein LOC133779364 [Humulus lupulus]|uniref:uncharacterized protein LOC133779364 n=1 Tax=Humulus lupulus TaxID=3486 RepID=UPI002B40E7A8|nr:uncharacterized protein LOC133779364 [Humulus lupulus]
MVFDFNMSLSTTCRDCTYMLGKLDLIYGLTNLSCFHGIYVSNMELNFSDGQPMEPNGDRRLRANHHCSRENGDVNHFSAIDDLDPWTAWAYKPRTILMLLIGACFLMLITIFLPEQKVVFLSGVLCLLQSLLVASIFFITGFYWFLLGWGFYWVVDNLWLSRSWKIEPLKLQNNDTVFLSLDHSHQVLRDGFCFFFLNAFTSWVSGVLDLEGSAFGDVVTSVKRGIWAMIAVFLAYCLLQAPSSILIRPHPAIWHLVNGMAVVYLVALTFFLFQKRDDARQFMKFLHPDLGVGNAV